MASLSNEWVKLLEALELHENLLHAETQAIAARDLDTIESILAKKEQSLQILVNARENIQEDPFSNKDAGELISQVTELQRRNAEAFRKLASNKTAKDNGVQSTKQKPMIRMLKNAYKNSSYGLKINRS
jgi:hypothetical protein